ncbi:hypothetical protein ACX6XY_19225 [Streptomyces sp. O3]
MSKLSTLKRSLALGSATIALASTSALGTAHAAGGESDTSSPAAAGSGSGSISALGLPGCMDLIVDGRTVRVYNWCSTTKYVKIYWAYASDTSCTGVKPNYVFTSKRSWPARFDKADTCA